MTYHMTVQKLVKYDILCSKDFKTDTMHGTIYYNMFGT